MGFRSHGPTLALGCCNPDMQALRWSTRGRHTPRQQAGYSSVGRASDCRMLQQSDGPWFDSGWPDFPQPCAPRCPSKSVVVQILRPFASRLAISKHSCIGMHGHAHQYRSLRIFMGVRISTCVCILRTTYIPRSTSSAR